VQFAKKANEIHRDKFGFELGNEWLAVVLKA
jgi:hypothetical protein